MDDNKRTPELLDALLGIYQYGSDTRSGRADGGPDDREWYRDAVIVMVERARAAIAKAKGE